MKLVIDVQELVKGKDKIKKIVAPSKLVKKLIYLEAKENVLKIFGLSEGNYGEILLPCRVEIPGTVELLYQSFDTFDYLDGHISLELQDNHILYQTHSADGQLNIVGTDLTSKSVNNKPTEWLDLPEEVFNAMYCTTSTNLNLMNVFIVGPIMATSNTTAFAGYKHPKSLTPLTDQGEFFPVTLPVEFFKLVPKENLKLGYGLDRVWLKAENLFVAATSINYVNKLVPRLGFYEEFDPAQVPYFVITLEQAKQLVGYLFSLSNSDKFEGDGRGSLVVKDGILYATAMGNEMGKGSLQIKCKEWRGEINFGLSTNNFKQALENVDYGLCKVLIVPTPPHQSLLLMGKTTRHLIGEAIGARQME